MILMYLAQIPFYVALLLIIDVIGAIMFKHKFKSDEKSIQTE